MEYFTVRWKLGVQLQLPLIGISRCDYTTVAVLVCCLKHASILKLNLNESSEVDVRVCSEKVGMTVQSLEKCPAWNLPVWRFLEGRL